MKILVVEDEVKLAEALARGLGKRGYTVDVVSDGKEALERIKLHHENYNLIILDLMLPGMSGQEICLEIRQKNIGTPVIILTAKDELGTKVDLLRDRADDYLAKPFSFDELEARIMALMRRPKETKSTVLKVKNIVLNPIDRTVTRNNKPVTLTLKEFALLEYFMSNTNRVINREELLNHLWDFNYTSFFSNALDVHIKNLRKKIDYAKGPSILETVRGVGYKMVE